MKMKSGVVEWDGQGFPPVGAKVEYWRNRNNLWAPCRISYVGSKYIVFKNETGAEKSRRKSQVRFRPIMSHREKIVELAMAVAREKAEKHEGFTDCRRFAEALYDTGLLNIRESQE